MKFEIQLLSADNAALLKNVAPDVFDNPIDQAQLQSFLNDERHVMYVAVDNDRVVGMASGVEYFHPDKPPQLWVNEIGVAPTHQRKGIGRSLIEALLDEAEDRHCVFAWLGTDMDNKPGQACFESVPGVEKPQPFLLYEWELSD